MGNLQMKHIKSDRLKLILSVFWFVFTFSMVTWWWIFSLRQLNSIAAGIPHEKYERLHWMLLWEGSILLAFIFVGGASLLFLTSRERSRNLRLRLFFSNFSHDLKTSLSRLRIRSEVIAQNNPNQELQELLNEASRLDLQLENSLWVARGEDQKLVVSMLSLSEVIGQLRVEWPELEIHLQRNAKIKADPTAIRSVLRNILQNAWLHGEATRIDIQVEKSESDNLVVSIMDNGSGFKGNLSTLGKSTLPTSERDGNGIGLYLTNLLLEKMNGKLSFESVQTGFKALLKIKGSLS
jgi:signal transduction histidine kinase